ncbi:hypothetical protein FB558_8616 [Pseudonocardia kunmingensis]|uniref:Uncharacterized protein n=1 Tax=Pseudonocardia kunmingensis TaxID=630975 RepID=A0A543CX81_9PSEU|nr:hypothetical protein FB558_8616 [Pseudonocardia kunmingensis]
MSAAVRNSSEATATARSCYSMGVMVDPVMVVVRVKGPAEVDPYVREAELTRAI